MRFNLLPLRKLLGVFPAQARTVHQLASPLDSLRRLAVLRLPFPSIPAPSASVKTTQPGELLKILTKGTGDDSVMHLSDADIFLKSKGYADLYNRYPEASKFILGGTQRTFPDILRDLHLDNRLNDGYKDQAAIDLARVLVEDMFPYSKDKYASYSEYMDMMARLELEIEDICLDGLLAGAFDTAPATKLWMSTNPNSEIVWKLYLDTSTLSFALNCSVRYYGVLEGHMGEVDLQGAFVSSTVMFGFAVGKGYEKYLPTLMLGDLKQIPDNREIGIAMDDWCKTRTWCFETPEQLQVGLLEVHILRKLLTLIDVVGTTEKHKLYPHHKNFRVRSQDLQRVKYDSHIQLEALIGGGVLITCDNKFVKRWRPYLEELGWKDSCRILEQVERQEV